MGRGLVYSKFKGSLGICTYLFPQQSEDLVVVPLHGYDDCALRCQEAHRRKRA
eukprot:jgi/Botrbrau1/18205/Bobra.53_1s0064.1